MPPCHKALCRPMPAPVPEPKRTCFAGEQDPFMLNAAHSRPSRCLLDFMGPCACSYDILIRRLVLPACCRFNIGLMNFYILLCPIGHAAHHLEYLCAGRLAKQGRQAVCWLSCGHALDYVTPQSRGLATCMLQNFLIELVKPVPFVCIPLHHKIPQ